jgi:hypothetical protein
VTCAFACYVKKGEGKYEGAGKDENKDNCDI